jgi:lysyl-tRNA synthetase, class I
MYWADKLAKQIVESGKYRPFYVDDMKTLSGYPTIGSLKGPVFHDLIFKALKSTGENVKYTYVWNDFDVIDELSPEFKESMKEYLGFPLRLAPSPVEGFENFGEYFAQDFKKVLDSLGIEAEYLSSYDMYKSGIFDEVIKIALDNSEKIQDIYERVAGSKKREAGWLPLQVICQNCGKLGTTRVFEWDGENVSYKCEPELVKWAQGCGNEGKISPFGGNGKLPWKVDWPAHWKVLGITVEGAGKDHTSAGGSLDIARALCSEVFNYPEPFSPQYEFILVGGKKMSTSKGLGLKARDAHEMLPPELIRFLFSRYDYNQQINFDPSGTMAIPDLFDEYDRCLTAFVKNGDSDLSRAFEMSHIGELPQKQEIFLPRFRDIANFIQQPTVDVFEKFAEVKGSELSGYEKEILEVRIKYAKIWVEKFAPDNLKLGLSENAENKFELSEEQKKYLAEVINLVNSDSPAEELQIKLYELTKNQGINPKSGFQAIYQVLIGKDFGPKAGAFLRQYPKDKVSEIIRKAIE